MKLSTAKNKDKPFCGVPDMVADIFSRSKLKRDLTVKKDVYERNGVKEYWMIDPWRESVEVYLLRDGKYFLDEIYHNYSEDELSEFKNIFGWYFE
ncbi:MAG: Uma2 family endonuclease [Selenomonadaceae bacterium]|nr:Uma2 family endonuclease [Selenomonadaceae bacterium]